MRAPRQDSPGTRAYRAEMEDGVMEILMVFILFIPAITVGQPAFAWMVVLPILLGRKLVHRIRNRLTYPRIGFVEAERESPRDLFGGMARGAIGAVAVVATVLFVWSDPRDPAAWRQVAPLLAALLCSGGFIHAARRSGLRRHIVFAAVAVGLGIFLSWVPGPHGYERVQIFLFGMSMILLASGLIFLGRFVRQHPALEPPVEHSDDL